MKDAKMVEMSQSLPSTSAVPYLERRCSASVLPHVIVLKYILVL